MSMISRLRNWLDERRSLKACGCACFCPTCGSVLNIRGIVVKHEPHVLYRCRCGTFSHWDFDLAPVPLLVRPTAKGISR